MVETLPEYRRFVKDSLCPIKELPSEKKEFRESGQKVATKLCDCRFGEDAYLNSHVTCGSQRW